MRQLEQSKFGSHMEKLPNFNISAKHYSVGERNGTIGMKRSSFEEISAGVEKKKGVQKYVKNALQELT